VCTARFLIGSGRVASPGRLPAAWSARTGLPLADEPLMRATLHDSVEGRAKLLKAEWLLEHRIGWRTVLEGDGGFPLPARVQDNPYRWTATFEMSDEFCPPRPGDLLTNDRHVYGLADRGGSRAVQVGRDEHPVPLDFEHHPEHGRELGFVIDHEHGQAAGRARLIRRTVPDNNRPGKDIVGSWHQRLPGVLGGASYRTRGRVITRPTMAMISEGSAGQWT